MAEESIGVFVPASERDATLADQVFDFSRTVVPARSLLLHVRSENVVDCERVYGIRPPLETAAGRAAGRESVVEAATALADPPQTPAPGSGQGRASSPIACGPVRHGVRLECSEIRWEIDLGGGRWAG